MVKEERKIYDQNKESQSIQFVKYRDNWNASKRWKKDKKRNSEGHCFVNEYDIILKGMQLIFMHYFFSKPKCGPIT